MRWAAVLLMTSALTTASKLHCKQCSTEECGGKPLKKTECGDKWSEIITKELKDILGWTEAQIAKLKLSDEATHCLEVKNGASKMIFGSCASSLANEIADEDLPDMTTYGVDKENLKKIMKMESLEFLRTLKKLNVKIVPPSKKTKDDPVHSCKQCNELGPLKCSTAAATACVNHIHPKSSKKIGWLAKLKKDLKLVGGSKELLAKMDTTATDCLEVKDGRKLIYGTCIGTVLEKDLVDLKGVATKTQLKQIQSTPAGVDLPQTEKIEINFKPGLKCYQCKEAKKCTKDMHPSFCGLGWKDQVKEPIDAKLKDLVDNTDIQADSCLKVNKGEETVFASCFSQLKGDPSTIYDSNEGELKKYLEKESFLEMFKNDTVAEHNVEVTVPTDKENKYQATRCSEDQCNKPGAPSGSMSITSSVVFTWLLAAVAVKIL